MNTGAIGGYFSLDPGDGCGFSGLSQALGYRSARSAMAAVLAAVKPPAVWIPNFICGAVVDAVRAVGIEPKHYPLSPWLGVPDEVEPEPDDWVICVDYFGLNHMAIDRAITRFGSHRVLTDASQSFYFEPRSESSTVYSPRKFFGVPDGGLLVTSFEVESPHASREEESLGRCAHLLYRKVGQVEKGYSKYRAAEASLCDCKPEAMSDLTRALLGRIDAETAAAARVRNYTHLAEQLRLNGLDIPHLPSGAVPLCCPVACRSADNMRTELAARRIFTSTYWPDAVIPEGDQIAMKLRHHTIYLPCDQRYTVEDMTHSAQILLKLKDLT